MRVKIISDGHGYNTKVVDAETGELLKYVSAIQWQVDARSRATAILTVIDVPVEITTDASVVKGAL